MTRMRLLFATPRAAAVLCIGISLLGTPAHAQPSWIMPDILAAAKQEGEMTISVTNSFKTRDKLNVGAQAFDVQRLELLEQQGVSTIAKLPFSLRILLENLLRCEDGRFVNADDILRRLVGSRGLGIQVDLFPAAAALLTGFLPGSVNKNPTHGLRRRAKEMGAAIPGLDTVTSRQT